MKKTIIAKQSLLLLFLPLFLHASIAVETSAQESVQPKSEDVVEKEELKGFSSMTIFLCIPNESPELSKKIDALAIKEFEKRGQVVRKKFPFVKTGEEETSLLEKIDNPFLEYEIEKIEDVKGEKLPFLKATLKFSAPTKIEKNNEYFRSTLWSRTCYIKGDGRHLEKSVSGTLKPLLDDFIKDYQSANQTTANKPTFYVLK